jgi:hypothetical protein
MALHNGMLTIEMRPAVAIVPGSYGDSALNFFVDAIVRNAPIR